MPSRPGHPAIGGLFSVHVTEFGTGITPGAGPFGITAGPDGNLWFTEFLGDRIGRIAPAACGPVAGPPKGPTVVTATSGPLAKQITLNWNEAQPNGSPITSYTGTCIAAALTPGLPTKSIPTGPGKRSVTIGGFVAGKNYHCFVRATNAIGNGANMAATPLVVKAKA